MKNLIQIYPLTTNHIIMMSCWEHEFPRLFLTIHLYNPSLLAASSVCRELVYVSSRWLFRWRTSLMSLSLLHMQCSTYFDRLTWIACEMGSRCLFWGVLLPEFVRDSTEHFCGVHIKVFWGESIQYYEDSHQMKKKINFILSDRLD